VSSLSSLDHRALDSRAMREIAELGEVLYGLFSVSGNVN
jgi:hypothetical protein